MASKKNHYEKAFSTFLDHPTFWKGAALFFHADSLSYWRKRKNIPSKPALCEESHLKQLSNLIADYFHHTEGKGKNCFVEPLRRNDLDYFFAYPEDYSQRSNEWVSGRFGPRPHNPAFEIIFVYSEQDGTLDINYSGNKKAMDPLQSFFAQAILGVDELAPDADDTRIYDLNPLMDADFNFSYHPGSGIQGIRVKKLRLSSKHNKGERVTLEADYQADENAVYQLLDQLSPALNVDQYYVTQIELMGVVALSMDKPAKKIHFRLTYPNSCNLKYEAEELVLRDMLEQSGIEPKEIDFLEE